MRFSKDQELYTYFMKMVKLLWCDNTSHESTALEVFSFPKTHGNDVGLPSDLDQSQFR